jgi:hypothetical protein
MKILFALLIAVSLFGCASDPFALSAKKAKEADELLAAGKITRSEYFNRALDETYKLPSHATKVSDLRFFNVMLTNSKQLESGSITKSEYDDRRNAARLQREVEREAALTQDDDRQRSINLQAATAVTQRMNVLNNQPANLLPQPYMLPVAPPVRQPVCQMINGRAVCQ